MPETWENFRGLLVNIDSSVLSIDFGDGYAVSEIDQESALGMFPGVAQWQIIWGKVCMVEKNTRIPVPTPGRGFGSSKTAEILSRKLALMRLCKEGNPQLWSSTIKIDGYGHFSVLNPAVPDRDVFSVNSLEAAAATQLLASTRLPFPRKEVQLAFDNFQLSYDVRNWNLAYLALMISLEVMLSDGDQDKAYKISRNAAVLLGGDKAGGRKAFEDVKRLYTKRSRLVHSGENVTQEEMIRLREYVRAILKRIISLDISKKDLFRALDETGFGEPLTVSGQ
jgi:hypothetical protein